ncbi:MAG: tryptophan--tRNA ligase [Deltaproteobacteria bacterium]|nr:tryptophan--tRNA ligase [Deltaproteobacteria bacterium]
MRKRLFSGIQPNGSIHLGNYLGAIRNWVNLQDEDDCLFCIVDLHAITIDRNPEVLRKEIRETAGILLACGIDPEKSTLFVQSNVCAHSEMTWIINCFTPFGWLNRMTQFKEKSKDHQKDVSVGLFDYPVLMASDILLYKTDLVAVGEDQKQHLEFTRNIAQRINSIYGDMFVIPEPLIPNNGARIMGLHDPTRKMSKSEAGKYHAINMLDPPEEIRYKIMRAQTDSDRRISFDRARSGIFNLITIYECLSGSTREEIEKSFNGMGYEEFKEELSVLISETLKPIQARYRKIMENPDDIDVILIDGADRASAMAGPVLFEFKDRIGLW